MSLCARAVALWLAACALAARAQPWPKRVNSEWPKCPGPYDIDKCRYINLGENTFEYLLYNKPFTLNIYQDSYSADCENVSIADPHWPETGKLRVETVSLRHCAVNSRALTRDLKLSFELLTLEDLPPGDISAADLAELPRNIKGLVLSAWPNVVKLEALSLNRYSKLRRLNLGSVHTEQVPRYLDGLLLYNTSLEILPRGVEYLAELAIKDDKLKSINLRNPRLNLLELQMTALKSLVLQEVSRFVLKDDLVERCPALEVLKLRRVRTRGLPPQLLRGAANLMQFSFTESFLTKLENDLFSYSKRLQLIDLSDNMLDSLPRNVFLKLPGLRVLRLSNNRLSTTDLREVAPLIPLTKLDLSGNPLGDLCPNGKQTPLNMLLHLQELSLAQTHATRICLEWLNLIRHDLRLLDLSGNQVANMSCFAVRTMENTKSNLKKIVTIIDLRKNPIQPFKCTEVEAQDGLDENDEGVFVKFLINYYTEQLQS